MAYARAVLPLFDNVPVRRFALVTYALIAANFVVWLWELGARSGRVDHYAFYPCALSGPCRGPAAADHLPWAEGTLTSMFMHASWVHILGNMLFLWIFGNNVEDVMGRARFLVFYLASGYAAMLTQAAVTLHYAGAEAASIPNVGASGAIAGILGAYFVLLPHARVVTLLFGFLPVPISAVLFLGLWFLFQLWQGGFSLTHPDAGGGVAFAAHVGGFVFGMLAVRLFQVRAPLRPRW
jgi:membrane associated rhomboid family serine protease